jgi:hypothetical protein
MILIAALLAVPAAYGAENGVDPTVSGVGARPLAMGRAFTAVADDINVLFANPAGLGLQKSWGITSMSTKLMERVEYKMVGGVYPTEFGTFGVGYLSILTPAGYATTDRNSLTGAQAISYGSSVMMLSYGLDMSSVITNSSSLGKLSIGAVYKTVSNRFEGYDGSGTGSTMDVGIIANPSSRLTAGLTFQNLGGAVSWQSGTKEDIPMNTRVGLALDLGKTLLAGDIESGASGTLLHGGVEYQLLPGLALRGGLENSSLSRSDKALNLCAGVGIKYDGIALDYAYRQDGTLANNSTHYISVSFQPPAPARAEVKTVEKPKPADEEYRVSSVIYDAIANETRGR